MALFFSTIGGLAGSLATITIQGVPAVASIASLLLPVISIILQIWIGKTGNYRIGGFIGSILLCNIIFPIIFFTSGGIQSGILVYYVLGGIVLFLLLGEKIVDCVIMTIVFLVVNSGCIYASYRFPELVIPIQSEFMIYMDIIVGFIISVALVQIALWHQNSLYKSEQRIAEKAMKAKDEFLASMSHELRTPLNAIIGLSETQMKTVQSESTYNDIRNIHESGMTLLCIINDILDLSKIGSGRFELVCVNYNTAVMINDTIRMNKVRIGEKPIEFQVNVDPSLPAVLYGDDLRIRQIISNLLSNAFKYTLAGIVRMDITSQHSGDEAVITVKISDTGIGIRESDIPSLFGKYNKFNNKENRNIEGTGLGLAITRELLEVLSGNITVESVYGKGSIFSFKIPQKIIDATPIGQNIVDSLSDFTYQDNKTPEQKFNYISLEAYRVLVVDDNEINLYVTEVLLSNYKLAIDCVKSGKEAIELIRNAEIKYNVIFMDHMMPELDGIETTKIIREEINSEYARTIPIVALTANALAGSEEMFLNSGFQKFLPKPIDIQKLDKVLKELLVDSVKGVVP